MANEYSTDDVKYLLVAVERLAQIECTNRDLHFRTKQAAVEHVLGFNDDWLLRNYLRLRRMIDDDAGEDDA